MKKVVTLMLLMSFVCSLLPAIGHAATVTPKLYMDGKELISDAAPRLVNQYTMVPLRIIAEQLGYIVGWDNRAKRATIQGNGNEILLTAGVDKASVNGVETELDAPALVDHGVTYVPLRFVGENLGLGVYWDAQAKAVHLYNKPTRGNNSAGGGSAPAEEVDSPAAPERPDDGAAGQAPGTAVPPELPAVPADAQAVVRSFAFDGLGRVTVAYDGQLTPAEPFWSGTKLVIDIPYASLSPEMSAALKAAGMSQGEMIVETMALQKVRYSYFSNDPSTVRIVLDMSAQADYFVSQGEGEMYIDLFMADLPAAPPAADDGADKLYKVVIDAGHGGKDPGAPSVTGKWEKDFNLTVALKVNALLEQEPMIQPYMTRSADVFVELADRAQFANNLAADLFISIHANRYEPHIRGTETYWRRDDSKSLAEVMHKHLLEGTGLPDREVRNANFHVIRETTMPAVLLETGCLSNSSDERALFTEAVQDRIAASIVAGIKEYLKL